MTTQEQIVESQLAIGMSPKVILLAYYRVQKEACSNDCYNIIAGVKPSFFKDIATEAKLKLTDIIMLFKDSRVVKVFKAFGWSFTNLYKSLQRGFKALKDVQVSLMEYAKQSGIGKWTARQLDSERLKDIDNWLKNHPKTKRITGAVVAGILVYIWWNMTFVGNPAFDFNMTDMLGALGGSFSLEKIFSGSQGAALLLLFFTGSVGLTFPWPGPNRIKFAIAVLGTLATKLGKRMRKAEVNPYLNTPPTKLRRDIKNQKDSAKKKLMQTALNAWRTTVPGPFRRKSMEAQELTKLAKIVLGRAGDDYENGQIRVHQYMNSIRVWDLTNAGKRGKKVEKMVIMDTVSSSSHMLDSHFKAIKLVGTFARAKSLMRDILHDYPDDFELYFDTERGVDVTPGGFKPVKVKTNELLLEADYNSFSIRDLVDTNNLPTCIPAIEGGKKDVKVFYRWVSDNLSKIKRLISLLIISRLESIK